MSQGGNETENPDGLREAARDAVREVLDPELGINVLDLGLVRAMDFGNSHLHVRMTLTSAACPMGASLVEQVSKALERALPADFSLDVELEWDPPWSPEMMSDAAKEELGWQA